MSNLLYNEESNNTVQQQRDQHWRIWDISGIIFSGTFCYLLGTKAIIVDKDCDNWYYRLNLFKYWSFCKIKKPLEKAV